MASVSDDLRKLREPTVGKIKEKADTIKVNEDSADIKVASVLGRFSSRKKEFPKINSNKKDEFSLALERSFSDAPVQSETKEDVVETHKEPVFTDNQFSNENVVPEEIPDSQKVLNNLKKEWSEIDHIQREEDSLAYPFGGWTDVEKYQK